MYVSIQLSGHATCVMEEQSARRRLLVHTRTHLMITITVPRMMGILLVEAKTKTKE